MLCSWLDPWNRQHLLARLTVKFPAFAGHSGVSQESFSQSLWHSRVAFTTSPQPTKALSLTPQQLVGFHMNTFSTRAARDYCANDDLHMGFRRPHPNLPPTQPWVVVAWVSPGRLGLSTSREDLLWRKP